MNKCPVKGCRRPEGDVGIIPAGAQVARWLCAKHYALVAAQPGSMGEVIKEVLDGRPVQTTLRPSEVLER